MSHVAICPQPQNLVMMGDTPDAGVKLVDFGLSRVITQGNELTQIMGTPDYVGMLCVPSMSSLCDNYL